MPDRPAAAATRPDLTILGIDLGTRDTGLMLAAFDRTGAATVLYRAVIRSTARCPADRETELVAQMQQIRAAVAGALRSLGGVVLDLVAVEEPPKPHPRRMPRAGGGVAGAAAEGDAAFFAGGNAVRTYGVLVGLGYCLLTLSRLSGVRKLWVNAATCKAAAGLTKLSRQPNVSSAAKARKRAMLKAAAIEWASAVFGVALMEDEDAIADAGAVCVAAWRILERETTERDRKRAQKALPGMAAAAKRKARVTK